MRTRLLRFLFGLTAAASVTACAWAVAPAAKPADDAASPIADADAPVKPGNDADAPAVKPNDADAPDAAPPKASPEEAKPAPKAEAKAGGKPDPKADAPKAPKAKEKTPPKDDRPFAPVVAPNVEPASAGKAHFAFHEEAPAHDRWWKVGEVEPPTTSRWESSDFFLPRMPRRYDAWGVRASWGPPVLLRIAADVELAPGKRKFLVRTRGLSRLWVDGALVVQTKVMKNSTDGHDAVKPAPLPPLPGLRPVAYGDQEAFGEVEVKAGWTRVVLEVMVGAKQFRPEPGELLVAVRTLDGRSYEILRAAGSDGSPSMLTEADVARLAARTETQLVDHDDRTRRAAAATQADFWAKRHKSASDWVKANPPPTPIAPAANPVDGFLADKVAAALAGSAGDAAVEAKHFHGKVLPLLRENCFRCHGEKEKGGLRLNSRESALKAGDSEEHAVVAGNPEKSELLRRVRSKDGGERMPPSGEGLTSEQAQVLEDWIKGGAKWPAPPVTAAEVAFAPAIDDAAFLRRVWLDTTGVSAPADEVQKFLADASPDKREKLVDRLLADPSFADHWTSYWQDVLGENPNMLKPSLNNSGPFRWYLYEALRDDLPFDRMVTELVLLRGSEREGGAAGFGLAADNDAPLAAKGQILASAFLGVELQCARCHDSPYHSTKQKDLYALASMIARKPLAPPKSSTVNPGFFEKKNREALIEVTMKPGEKAAPSWPFAAATGSVDDEKLSAAMLDPKDTRERLAALVTSPRNERFAQVVVNRVWKRLMGAGIVEPAHDWEGRSPSHPELLSWLAKDFTDSGYSLKHVVRRIMTSEVYQRPATGVNLTTSADQRYFTAPDRRRLTAEQVVDSLYAAAGMQLDVEELTFDPEGLRAASVMISLGRPTRAWQFATLANERDRPSLSLPRAQAVADVLEAFGWNGSRQGPVHQRETAPTVLQPGVLANSVLSTWVSRASEGSGLAQEAVDAPSPGALVDRVFLRYLGRLPSPEEKAPFESALAIGFADRIVPEGERPTPSVRPRLGRVSWSNHLAAEANRIQMENETRARAGAPVDPRLAPAWRTAYEDVVWAVMNSPEFVWVP